MGKGGNRAACSYGQLSLMGPSKDHVEHLRKENGGDTWGLSELNVCLRLRS